MDIQLCVYPQDISRNNLFYCWAQAIHSHVAVTKIFLRIIISWYHGMNILNICCFPILQGEKIHPAVSS